MRFPAFVAATALTALAAGAEPPVVLSQAGPGRALSLTVYTAGRALVRDTRPVTLPAGEVDLEFADIAAAVMPETVSIRGDDLTVLEQNYEYDLLSPQTLLAKFVGREVRMVVDEPSGSGGALVQRTVTGRLLSIENGTVWRIGDTIVSNPRYRELVFPSVPSTLRERPTLVWRLDSTRAAERRLEATYLTGRMNWQADYVLTLDAAGTTGRLQGWVTLSNESGTSYPDARVQLVAGNVHLAPAPSPVRAGTLRVEKAAMAAQEESFAEYHLYTLPRPTTLRDKQKKQITLLEAEGVRAARRYVVAAPGVFYSAQGGEQRQDVRADVELANTKASGLGMPLPGGVVRLYQLDSRGTPQFIGEDRIAHTPEGESVNLTVGTAFDITAERRQTDFRQFGSTTESAYELKLRNHKDVPVTVEVREQLAGDWEILSSSLPYRKLSAFEVQFDVAVKPDREAVLTYRARIRR